MKISTAQEAINGNSNDTVITPLRLKQVLNSKNIGGGSSGGITKETDPIFKASPAAKITNEDIEKWNSGTGGDIPDIDVTDFKTKWENAELTSDFKLYNDASYCRYAKVGNLVNIQFVLSPASANNVLNSYTETTAFVLPKEYRPSQNLTVLCQGTNLNVFVVGVNTSGNVNIYRYRSGDSLASTPPGTSVWLPCNITYMIDSGTLIAGGSGEGGVTEESDPTVPQFVKEITQDDIDRWNSGTGGGTIDVSEKLSKVLYDNPDGTSSTAQLTETYANFKYLEVFCNSSDNTYAYTRIENPVDGKRATVMGGWFGTYSYFKNCVLILSDGDKINVTQGNASQITGSNNCASESKTDAMKVVKVVGYYDENVLIVGNNGTEIVNLNEPKNVMTLKLDADINCSTNDYYHIPLSLYNSSGDKLTNENGYVKIGKGVSKVKVSGAAKFETSSTATKHIHIDKNDETIAWALINPASANLGAIPTITPVLVDVKEGDLIDLKYYTVTATDVIEGHRTCFTYLTVEAVEDNKNITVNNTIDGIPIGSEFEYDGEEVPDGYEEVPNLVDMIYPVGSIYITTSSTNPELLFEGTSWQQLKDKFLLSAGDTYEAGSTGGEAEHTLTVDEIPSHKHNVWELPLVDAYGGGNSATGYALPSMSSKTAPKVVTGDIGGGQSHNNMPPYLTVYMWERIA